jgi:hypothetical protein
VAPISPTYCTHATLAWLLCLLRNLESATRGCVNPSQGKTSNSFQIKSKVDLIIIPPELGILQIIQKNCYATTVLIMQHFLRNRAYSQIVHQNCYATTVLIICYMFYTSDSESIMFCATWLANHSDGSSNPNRDVKSLISVLSFSELVLRVGLDQLRIVKMVYATCKLHVCNLSTVRQFTT